jgi:hypothetical protein
MPKKDWGAPAAFVFIALTLGLTLFVIGFSVAMRLHSYRECRAHGFSVTFCSTALL